MRCLAVLISSVFWKDTLDVLAQWYTESADEADRHAGFRPIIGEDSVPWDEIFRICETTGGTKWYIVEYESDAYPPLDAVERCLSALKAMGK